MNPVVRGALLLFVLSIPFEMPKRSFPIETTTMTAMLFLAATLTAPKASYGRIPSSLMWFATHLWLLAIAAVVNKIEFVTRALEHFFLFTVMLLLMWAMSNLLKDARLLKQVLMALVLTCAARGVLQILGIGATTYNVWTGGERTSLFGQNANLSAMILSAGIVTCAGLVLAPARWLPNPKLFALPLAGAMGWSAIETGSRGGVVCAMVGLAVFLLSGRTPGTRIRNVLLGVVAMGLIVFGVTRSPMMRARFAESEQGKLAGREVIYPALLEMVRERPLFGWGPIDNQFEIARRIHERMARRPSRDAHNLFGELFTTSGVFGAVPFIIGLGLAFASAWRARKGALGFLPFALLSAVFMGCLSGTWIASKILWFVIGIAVAAGMWWSSPSTIDGWSIEPCVE